MQRNKYISLSSLPETEPRRCVAFPFFLALCAIWYVCWIRYYKILANSVGFRNKKKLIKLILSLFCAYSSPFLLIFKGCFASIWVFRFFIIRRVFVIHLLFSFFLRFVSTINRLLFLLLNSFNTLIWLYHVWKEIINLYWKYLATYLFSIWNISITIVDRKCK